MDDRKNDLFFGLIRSTYGASKFAAQWPTELDLQAAKTMWAEQIGKHDPDELRAALRHAQSMAANGEADWQWPNIGLILSGAKRYGSAAHKMFLPAPARDILPAESRGTMARNLMKEIGL